MAKNKKGFILYADLEEVFNELTDEQAGKLIKHIMGYVNDKSPVCNDSFIKIAFIPIKQQLKRDLEKWEETKEKRSIAGKASAEARKNKSSKKTTNSTHVKSVKQNSTNSTVNVNVNDNVNDNVSVNEKDIKYNVLFDLFWSAYDKKRGDKEKLRVKFKTLSESDIRLIMDYIPKYKISQPDKQYRKDPSTFLNNKGWLDEIITSNTEVKKVKQNPPF